eukprot:scaffold27251_cov177-Skeletonema_menzelii.AAC.4
MDAQDQLLYPILGRPSNILNDYIVFPIVLGTGYYGTVRECRHRQTGLTYAVKAIEKAKIQRLDHLRREVDLLASVEHSAVMRSVNVYEDMNYVHIVTQKCSGGELFDKIVERTTEKGCFEELSAARIIKSLLEAVAYLHANGIVHRDIKPENILFETQEEDSPIKLIDFGLSRRHVHGVEPNLSNPVGSVYYMSPELLECDYSAPTDIWSIGIITYILLCGYAPFSGDDNCEIFNAILIGNLDFPSSEWMTKSPLCIDFIKCLLRRDPTKRWAKAKGRLQPRANILVVLLALAVPTSYYLLSSTQKDQGNITQTVHLSARRVWIVDWVETKNKEKEVPDAECRIAPTNILETCFVKLGTLHKCNGKST